MITFSDYFIFTQPVLPAKSIHRLRAGVTL